jgi:hypothetical protein
MATHERLGLFLSPGAVQDTFHFAHQRLSEYWPYMLGLELRNGSDRRRCNRRYATSYVLGLVAVLDETVQGPTAIQDALMDFAVSPEGREIIETTPGKYVEQLLDQAESCTYKEGEDPVQVIRLTRLAKVTGVARSTLGPWFNDVQAHQMVELDGGAYAVPVSQVLDTSMSQWHYPEGYNASAMQ